MATRTPSEDKWTESLHRRIAQNIREARNAAGMSAQDIADVIQSQFGYSVSRDKIANYESGRKSGLDLAEFLVIAAALRVPPVTLIFDGAPDEPVEVLPKHHATTVGGLAWFCGDPALDDETVTDPQSHNARLLKLIRERARQERLLELQHKIMADFEQRGIGDKYRDGDMYVIGELLEKVGELNQQIAKIVERELE